MPLCSRHRSLGPFIIGLNEELQVALEKNYAFFALTICPADGNHLLIPEADKALDLNWERLAISFAGQLSLQRHLQMGSRRFTIGLDSADGTSLQNIAKLDGEIMNNLSLMLSNGVRPGDDTKHKKKKKKKKSPTAAASPQGYKPHFYNLQNGFSKKQVVIAETGMAMLAYAQNNVNKVFSVQKYNIEGLKQQKSLAVMATTGSSP